MRRGPANRFADDAVGANGDGLHGAVVTGHAVRYLSALESRTRRARRRDHAVAVADDDLRIGADVHQQDNVVFLVQPHGEQVGRDVSANV